MVITESNISVLGCVKNKDNLPQLIITSMANHKWKKPYTCDYKDDVKNHERIVELLSSEPFYAADRIEEYAWLVCMKTHGELIGVYELSHGGLNTTIMDYRIIMMKAIIAGSAHMVIAHNHPTGNPTPSEADKILTKELNNIATLHNIDLYDHIIIGKNGWESVFKVMGLQNHDNFDFTHQAIYPDDIQVNEMERDSMNKEVCESFINFCDDMMIANEGFLSNLKSFFQKRGQKVPKKLEKNESIEKKKKDYQYYTEHWNEIGPKYNKAVQEAESIAKKYANYLNTQFKKEGLRTGFSVDTMKVSSPTPEKPEPISVILISYICQDSDYSDEEYDLYYDASDDFEDSNKIPDYIDGIHTHSELTSEIFVYAHEFK